MRTIQFIPADWLELALWNRPMVVYSRPVAVELFDPANAPLIAGVTGNTGKTGNSGI